MKWIAIDQDTEEVIACGETLKEAKEKASEAGYDEPILTTVWDGTPFFYGGIVECRV